MKIILIAVILSAISGGNSCIGRDSEDDRIITKYYEFDFQFFTLMAERYLKSTGYEGNEPRPRVNPRAMFLASVGDFDDSESFSYGQYLGRHFMFYRATETHHAVLERVYEKTMSEKLRTVSRKEVEELAERDRQKRRPPKKLWPDIDEIPEWYDPAEKNSQSEED